MVMSREKEEIISFLRKEKVCAISKIHRLVGVPYYKLKYNILPELEKDGIIKMEYDSSNRYAHVYINDKGGKTCKK